MHHVIPYLIIIILNNNKLTLPPVGNSTVLSLMAPLMTSVATLIILRFGALSDSDAASKISHAMSTAFSSLSLSSLSLRLAAPTFAGFRRRLPLLSLRSLHAMQSESCSVQPMTGLLDLLGFDRHDPQLRHIFLGWISVTSSETSILKISIMRFWCCILFNPLFGLGHLAHLNPQILHKTSKACKCSSHSNSHSDFLNSFSQSLSYKDKLKKYIIGPTR